MHARRADLDRPAWPRRHALGRLVLALMVATAVVGLDAPSAAAQSAIYRWLDDAGTIHYSQGIESIPPQHRSSAVVIGHDRPAPPEPPKPLSRRPAAPLGGARIDFPPGEAIMVSARVNDGPPIELMLDTGASRTVINPAALSALGVSYRDAVRGSIRGVTGEAEVLAVRVDSIDVSGARYGPLLVVSHDTGFKRGDGLLGRDFLDHFRVTIDNASGVVILSPK
jgi:hypothetical protein